jgi:hypothetical protein
MTGSVKGSVKVTVMACVSPPLVLNVPASPIAIGKLTQTHKPQTERSALLKYQYQNGVKNSKNPMQLKRVAVRRILSIACAHRSS